MNFMAKKKPTFYSELLPEIIVSAKCSNIRRKPEGRILTSILVQAFRLIPVFCLMLVSCSAPEGTGITFQDGWPVLNSYGSNQTCQEELPLGGIGTGTISLTGNGEFNNWEIPSRMYNGDLATWKPADAPFFIIYTLTANATPMARLLSGPVCNNIGDQPDTTSPLRHLPRFKNASFDAVFPFGQVGLYDQELPVDITIRAFNPMIPGALDASSLPLAIIYVKVTNKTLDDVIVAVCGNMRNTIAGREDMTAPIGEERGSESTGPVRLTRINGVDNNTSITRGNTSGNARQDNLTERTGSSSRIKEDTSKNRNDYLQYGYLQGIFMHTGDIGIDTIFKGSMAISTAGEESITWRTTSAGRNPYNAIQNIWDDFTADGELTADPNETDGLPFASLAVKDTIRAGMSRYFRYLITWHFPERAYPENVRLKENHNATRFQNAWDAAKRTITYIPQLETNSLEFINALSETDLPNQVLENALNGLRALRSPFLYCSDNSKLLRWESLVSSRITNHDDIIPEHDIKKSLPFLFGVLAETKVKAENTLIQEGKETPAKGDIFRKNHRMRRRSASTAGWAGVIAYTGFNYLSEDYSFQIRASEGITYWSNGYAWGNCVVTDSKEVKEITIRVYNGELKINKIILKDWGERVISDEPMVIKFGEESSYSVFKYR